MSRTTLLVASSVITAYSFENTSKLDPSALAASVETTETVAVTPEGITTTSPALGTRLSK